MKISVSNPKTPVKIASVWAGEYQKKWRVKSGSIVTFSDAWVGSKIYPKASIVPVQSGSGTPSPDNVRPITGYSSVDVYNDGKYGGNVYWNQLVPDTGINTTTATVSIVRENGKFTLTGTPSSTTWFTRSGFTPSVISGHVYAFLLTKTLPSGVQFASLTSCGISYSNKSAIYKATADGTATALQIRLETSHPWDDSFYFSFHDVTAIFGETKANEIYAMEQAEAGTGVAYFRSIFPKDYYAYNAGETTNVSAVNGDPYEKVTISLGTTIYGGILNVDSGVLTVDRAYLTLNSTVPSGSNGFRNITELSNCVRAEYYPYRAIGAIGGEIISDRFESGNTSDGNPYMVATGSDSARMYITLPLAYNTEELIRGWFTSNPSNFVYELATPTTVQLTGEEITALLGENNVWCNSGDIEVTYRKGGA